MTVACSAYDSECLTRAAKRFHRHVFDQNTNILKTHWVKCTRPLTTGDRLLREHVEVSKDESRGPFRMPVAPLVQTCQQLLETVKPLLADSQLEAATKLVHKFTEKGGIGEKLQSLLQKRAGERESWLSEWWQNYGYLDYRASVPINVSPGIVMKEQVFRDSNDQIDFTSKFISGVLRYKKRLDSGQIASEQMLGQPVCMSQYYKIFASCRRPHPLRDSIAQHDTKEARHVVVLHNNHFFLMPITDREGQTPNHRQLRDQLRLIIDASNNTMAPPVGLMTGCDRDYWAAATANLLRDPNNHDIIDCIERSAFVLCLDRPHAPTLEPRPLTRPREPTDRYTTLGRQMNYGGGSLLNSANRWYDKTLQIIIGSDGAFGASYEHTAAEGPPVVTLLDEAYDYVLALTLVAVAPLAVTLCIMRVMNLFQQMSSPKDFEPCQEMETPKKLEFVIDSSIEEDMKAAAEIVDKQISRFELHSYTFRDFGKESIKNLKMSPDAFIQVSLQLAYFRFHNISVCRSQYHVLDSIAPVAPVTPPRNPTARLHSAPCATYESGSLRRFHSGRTDVIRSCSSHSLAYTMAMVDPECSDKQRAAAFRVAVAAHSKYSKQVVMGNGIDRHLLGLKLIAEENNIPIPDLFKHPAWTESTSWKLSTSQVASKSDSLLTFGAVVADGYGFCYNPCDDHINYMVSAWRESRLTSCADFSRQVQRALLDGRRVLHTVSVEK